MDRAEGDAVIIIRHLLVRLAEQGDLREKLVEVAGAVDGARKLREILLALLPVLVGRAQVRAEVGHNAADELGGRQLTAGRVQAVHEGEKGRPVRPQLRRHAHGGEDLAMRLLRAALPGMLRLPGLEGLIPGGEQLGRGGVTDAGEGARDAPKGHLIARIDEQAQKSDDVLDVGLFEEAKPAGDAEGDVAACELHLHVEAVEVRAVEHGDVAARNAGVEQLVDAAGHEGRLRSVVGGRHDGGQHAAGGAGRAQLLFVALRVAGDGDV